MCGNCKDCVCVKGGYQVHVTCEVYRDYVAEILECEFLTIKNVSLKGTTYTEYITSKNFQDLRFAQEYLVKSYDSLRRHTCIPIRLKIEASPNKNMPYLYREIHYTVTGKKIKIPDSFRSYSKDKEFATVRFFPGQEPYELHLPHRTEDVIFDSNLFLDVDLCPKTRDYLIKNPRSAQKCE